MQIPKYAQHVPRSSLVRIVCRGACQVVRYAEVSKTPWSSAGPNMDMELSARCLVCGYTADDNYNWMRL
ncbi:MAG: hypothetical protein H6744_08310 [Deltaproteobacteria bacterium]|nr:hypothetical protein [Deltaproteobacteria bacterium]MCB9786680.1 hypothetical protein [Deltaproteobacteria bacterium]